MRTTSVGLHDTHMVGLPFSSVQVTTSIISLNEKQLLWLDQTKCRFLTASQTPAVWNYMCEEVCEFSIVLFWDYAVLWFHYENLNFFYSPLLHVCMYMSTEP